MDSNDGTAVMRVIWNRASGWECTLLADCAVCTFATLCVGGRGVLVESCLDDCACLVLRGAFDGCHGSAWNTGRGF